MKILILGSGTSQGVPVIGCNCSICLSSNAKNKRLRSSILVSKDDVNILIDIGPDFRQQMLRAEVSHIEAIFITHEHNDHIAGIDDIRPFNFMSKSTMPMYALERVAKDLKAKFGYIFGDSKYPGLPSIDLHVFSHSEMNVRYGNMDIQAINILHGQLPILGYKIDDLVYLTDIKSIENDELQKIKGCRVLIISCLRRSHHHAHLNLEEALGLICDIGPGIAYLTHISHDFGFHNEIELSLPQNVFVAYDEMEIEV